MSRFFSGDANDYSTLVTSLNGRFRRLAPRTKSNFEGLGDFDLSRNSSAKTLILLIIATVILGAWAKWTDFDETIEMLKSYNLGRIYIITGFVLLLINIAAFFWRLWLVLKYRPTPTSSNEQLPTCTVIVPAYNEGRQVLRTLRSIARSDYPAEKLQIFAVDDGSADNTWYWIQKAAREFQGRIEAIRMPHNVGKRSALYHGFKNGTGEVFVTIDSDSLIEAHTLRRLVSPFKDNAVGGVAGSVRVLNRHEGIIPRMLEVSFAYCFEFIRASESMIDTVFCTPGALAAYRRSALLRVVDKWNRQTFFGRSANIGEDRALTNWILRTGATVKFQSDAIVYTNVPTRYEGLCKMLLRWGRSNVRENIMMNQFIWRNFRSSPVLGARVNYLLSWLNMTVPNLLFLGVIFCILWHPDIFVMQVMLGSILAACVPASFYALRRQSSNALWAFAHNIFWVVALAWISAWSLLTVHKDNWLTRDLVESPAASEPQSQLSHSAA